MKKIGLMLLMVGVGIGIGLAISGKLAPVRAAITPGTGYAAVPGDKGSEDVTGPYEVVKNWPQDISTLPGNAKWTYGAGESVFAESPDRIYMLFRGELPKMAPPKARLLPEVGPSISFPVSGFWRDATVASLPGTGGTDNPMSEWLTAWEGKSDKIGIKGPPYRELGRDAEWKNCLVIVNRQGKIQEVWSQWDKQFRRPHSIYIRKNASGWWTTTCKPSTSSATTANSFCRPSAPRKWTARMPHTSTVRPISTGCPTGRSSSPTVTRARASPSLTRMESS